MKTHSLIILAALGCLAACSNDAAEDGDGRRDAVGPGGTGAGVPSGTVPLTATTPGAGGSTTTPGTETGPTGAIPGSGNMDPPGLSVEMGATGAAPVASGSTAEPGASAPGSSSGSEQSPMPDDAPASGEMQPSEGELEPDPSADGEDVMEVPGSEDEDPGGGYPEHLGAACDVSAGEYGTDNPNLPNPFQMNDGSIVSSMDEWQCRRAEIIKDLEEYEVGPKPPPPQVDATFDDGRLNVTVTTDSGSITLSSSISGSGDCVMIGMGGFGGGLVNGCRTMNFNHDQVVRNDHSSGNAWPDDPYYTVYPELWEEAPNGGASPIENGNRKIGNYSAWSWGVSRLIDGLELTQEQHGIDLSKIGVQGCSYAGKMALWAGAWDQRIALTIAQESGGGGAPAWRTSQDYEQSTGQSVESIGDTNWGWFKDSLAGGDVEAHLLPHDHHELIALIAPRAFILLPGDPDNAWLGAHSAYVSFMAAKEVWKAMGVEDRAGIVVHNRGGAHCSASSGQTQGAQAFVDKFLRGQEANTNIENGLNDNWQAVVDWDSPTIPNP